MKLLKGYVLRMYPDEKQEELINKTFGYSRFIYNYFLNDKIKEYKKPVDRYYPSSRIRNICNYQNKEVKDFSGNVQYVTLIMTVIIMYQ